MSGDRDSVIFLWTFSPAYATKYSKMSAICAIERLRRV